MVAVTAPVARCRWAPWASSQPSAPTRIASRVVAVAAGVGGEPADQADGHAAQQDRAGGDDAGDRGTERERAQRRRLRTPVRGVGRVSRGSRRSVIPAHLRASVISISGSHAGWPRGRGLPVPWMSSTRTRCGASCPPVRRCPADET